MENTRSQEQNGKTALKRKKYRQNSWKNSQKSLENDEKPLKMVQNRGFGGSDGWSGRVAQGLKIKKIITSEGPKSRFQGVAGVSKSINFKKKQVKSGLEKQEKAI